MAQGEVKRIFAKQAGLLMQKAADEELSDIIFVGFEGENNGFKKAFYYFIETILTEMAANGFSDDTFVWIQARWTQSFSFIDVFTQHNLISLRFAQPAAKHVGKKLKNQMKRTEQKKRMTENTGKLPESLSP